MPEIFRELRVAKALYLMLDELIFRIQDARNAVMNLDDLSDEELVRLRQELGLRL